MPLVDLHATLGPTPETLALVPNEAESARTYADQFGVDVMCFSAPLAQFDLAGGNAMLAEQLRIDPRFRGWVTLSIHQPEQSSELARRYLLKEQFCGTLIRCCSDSDALTTQGGHEVLNALRRYSKPVLVEVGSAMTTEAVIQVAREFPTMKFLVSPQNEELTRVVVPAMKEVVNTLFLPVAAFAERDIMAQATQTLGDRRVVWCSSWGRFHPIVAMGMIRDSALSASQRERVGSRNARDVLT
jgi:predicted TIM-barrel fold metal-dependent hydrolase